MVETTPLQDQRGLFYRAFCDQELVSVLQDRSIRQITKTRFEAFQIEVIV